MAISGIETIDYSLVLVGSELLKTREELIAIFENVDTEMTLSVDSESDNPSRELQIPKDRIKITSMASIPRTKIQMDYPDSDQNLDRFAEISSLSISCSENAGQLRALGYNVSLIYSQDSAPSAQEYLSRLFKMPVHSQWDLHGGSCTLEFRESGQAENRQVNLVLEPRGKDRTTPKVYANLNIHLEAPELPTREEIKSNISRARDAICEYIHLIDRE